MIDFLLSIGEYDRRQAWKIRYPLSTFADPAG